MYTAQNYSTHTWQNSDCGTEVKKLASNLGGSFNHRSSLSIDTTSVCCRLKEL
jgi:hypothetical protein